jgi:2'-hydroxyisoflavone reductase
MIDRRALVAGLAASAALAPAPVFAKKAHPKRVLILGGTNFVGPHLVHGAELAGYEVTLFNRGRTNPHLFPSNEKIRGDRLADGGLSRLAGDREWDMVIDTWQGHPRAVRDSARMLSGRSKSYVYISSIAVYGGFRKIGLTEQDPILPLVDAPALDSETITYSWAKRMGEHLATSEFSGASTVVRGGAIFGYDYSASLENQNSYWPLRLRKGGDVMAPGDGSDLLQWSDVAALADFAIAAGAQRLAGDFNAVNAPRTFRDYLAGIQSVTAPKANLVWVPQSTIMANGGVPFENVPFWIPSDDPEPGFFQFDPSKAHAAGLRSESISSTMWHQLKSYRGLDQDYSPNWASFGGLPQAVEAQILAANAASAQ